MEPRVRAAGVAGVAPLIIVVVAVVAWVALVLPAGVRGQGTTEPRVVRIQTLNVYDTLYMLKGGSNTLAMMRDDGVVIVDSKPAGWTQPLLQTLETVTEGKVQTIINTHAHRDHVGGNVAITTATEIVAHANARDRMATYDEFRGANAKFLPNRIVTDHLTLFSGADAIDLHYFGKGHTDGDLVVVFPEKRMAHFGDLIVPKAVPVVDAEAGGSVLALPETLARAVAQISNVARVTTGHDEASATSSNPAVNTASRSPRTLPWAEVQEYADFTRDFVAAARQALSAGKTAEQAASSLQLPERYKGYDLSNARATIQALARELGK